LAGVRCRRNKKKRKKWSHFEGCRESIDETKGKKKEEEIPFDLTDWENP